MPTVNMVPTIINNKWEILLPEHRAARPERRTWEYARLASMYEELVMQQTTRPILFYVGAEEGDMAGLLAKWGVKLGLFEPNDRVSQNIKAIWESNELEPPLFTFSGFASNCNVNPILNENRFPVSALGTVIADHGFKDLSEAGDIPQIKIDDIGIIPTALSIDVEGSEWIVLEGAEQTLINHHPKIWLSLHPEFMFDKYKKYSLDLRRWIIERGYTETLLDYQHEVHLFYKYTGDI